MVLRPARFRTHYPTSGIHLGYLQLISFLTMLDPKPRPARLQRLNHQLVLLKLASVSVHRGVSMPRQLRRTRYRQQGKMATRGTRLMRWHVAAPPDRWLSASRQL